jgi:hypothetical protein
MAGRKAAEAANGWRGAKKVVDGRKRDLYSSHSSPGGCSADVDGAEKSGLTSELGCSNLTVRLTSRAEVDDGAAEKSGLTSELGCSNLTVRLTSRVAVANGTARK